MAVCHSPAVVDAQLYQENVFLCISDVAPCHMWPGDSNIAYNDARHETMLALGYDVRPLVVACCTRLGAHHLRSALDVTEDMLRIPFPPL